MKRTTLLALILICACDLTATGAVSRVDRPEGRFSEFRYDVRGRLSRVDYHDGSFETYSYNRDGLLTEAANDNTLVKIKRDTQGRITEEWQDGHTVQSRYDKRGQRTALTSSLGANLSMGYTETGLLKGMKTDEWEMGLQHDQRGLEIERVLTGGVVSRKSYDNAGRIERHGITSRGRETRKVRYAWGTNDRLISITNELTKKEAWFDYDTMGNLVGATYDNVEKLFRVPDAMGNLYKSADRKDRKYGAGGRLLEAEGAKYDYDAEGNLTEKITADGKRWSYEWNANGSLRTVTRPDFRSVYFEYDALGRRTSKFFDRNVTRWVWDGNTPLHEWSYPFDDRPRIVKDEYGFDVKDREEPTDNITTWIFEEGTFRPTAKLSAAGNHSIITDHLGTPAQMYDGQGTLTWEADFDIYGKVRNFAKGSLSDCPFRYQGQYEDAETGLYYNRFRYYDPESGGYLSQDPIGLAGNNPTLYGYVKDVNSWVDKLGLAVTNTVDFTGHPDLYNGTGKNTVTIVLTGNRSSDFTRAFKESGVRKSDAVGYTWHHCADFDSQTGTSTMQLIKTSTHEANIPHKGSAGQFADFFEVEYDTYEAKLKAFEQGWRDKPRLNGCKS